MLNWRFRRIHLVGVVAAVASLGLFVSNASSQTGREPAVAGVEQKLLARVGLLERRLAEMEERLQLLERGEKPTRTATGTRLPAATEIRRPREDCAAPSYVDNQGLRRIRPECLQPGMKDNCESPFVVAPDGIKRVKSDCL